MLFGVCRVEVVEALLGTRIIKPMPALTAFLRFFKRRPNALLAFAVLTLANIVLNFLLPANHETLATYHLTELSYHVLLLLINSLLGVIWFAAFYGYKVLHEYSQKLHNTTEGKSFHTIARGLTWLAWGAPLNAILSLVLYAFVHNNYHRANAALIIEHYGALIVPVVAFSLIATGTHMLPVRNFRPSSRSIKLIMFFFTLFGVLFSYYSLNSIRDLSPNPFRMPLWLILLTVLVPYLYSWYMGAYAAYEIIVYRQKAKGLLYRRALTYLVGGLSIIIASSIMIEFLASSSRYLTQLTLNGILLLIYLLLAMYAGGYGLVALGAKRLKKIEEV